MECYLELADKVRTGLAHIDPYFQKLADAMVAWIYCWQKLNPEPSNGGLAAGAAAAALGARVQDSTAGA